MGCDTACERGGVLAHAEGREGVPHGALLHEYAHRAGAVNDELSNGYGYIPARRNVTGNVWPVFQAENWRFYLWQMAAIPALEAQL